MLNEQGAKEERNTESEFRRENEDEREKEKKVMSVGRKEERGKIKYADTGALLTFASEKYRRSDDRRSFEAFL